MFFKREAVKNAKELEGLMVTLKNSKKDVTVATAIELADKFENMHGYASGDHMVKLNDDEEMSVNDLIKEHMSARNEIEALKKKHDAEGEEMEDVENEHDDVDDPAAQNDTERETEVEMADVGDRGGDKHLHNEDEEDEEKGKKKNVKKNSKEKTYSLADAKAILDKAARVKNAGARRDGSVAEKVLLTPHDQVERGKELFG